MSRLFGAVRQLGYVVDDIEAGMRHWANALGVGPWFYAEQVPVEGLRYRDAPSSARHAVALANSGPLQIELIQQRNDGPSMYRDFRAAHGEGLHHVAYWTETFDADMARLAGLGLVPQMQGEVGRDGRFVYFDTGAHPGSVVELSEIAGPKGAMFRAIHAASEGWNGANPIRPFPDLSALSG